MMRIKTEAETLRSAISQVKQFCGSGKVLPILRSVKVEASGNSLTLSATDMDTWITLKVDGVEVEEEGVALFPSDELSRLLLHTDGQVEIEVPELGENEWGGRMTLRLDRSIYRLPIFNPNEYPDPADALSTLSTGAVELVVDGSEFASALRLVAPFADHPSSRFSSPVLKEIMLCCTNGVLEIVATDAYKLALVKLTSKEATGKGEIKVLVPAMKVSAIASLCEREPNLRLKLKDDNAVGFFGEGWSVVQTLKALTPYDYQKALPDFSTLTTTIELSNCKAVSDFLTKVMKQFRGKEKERAKVKVSCKPQEGIITLTALDSDDEEVAVKRLSAKVNGEGGEWLFRLNLLSDVVSAVQKFPVKVSLRKESEHRIPLMAIQVAEPLPFEFLGLLAAIPVSQV